MNLLIREGKQYPEILCVSCFQELIRYHHHNQHVTPLLWHHANPLLTMDHHLYHVTSQPYSMHRSYPSSCQLYHILCRSSHPHYVDYHLSSITIVIAMAISIFIATMKQNKIWKRAALRERWYFMRNKKYEMKKSLTLRPHDMKLCRLT